MKAKNYFKQILLKISPNSWVHVYQSTRFLLDGGFNKLRYDVQTIEYGLQMLARLHLQNYGKELNSFYFKNMINLHELKIYSQNGEDGILLYLFSLIGTNNRKFIEFGIGNGRQCNTANLSLNFGWSGLLMDIDTSNVIQAKQYYEQQLGKSASQVHICQAKVTRENINDLLLANNIVGEVDLLSIDIDGNDYWVWDSIEAVQPRVVVIEYNASFGPQRSITIPYDPHFNLAGSQFSGFYYGASLPALSNLAQKKGYILVGCESNGVNAFFVRSDLANKNKLESALVENAFYLNRRREEKYAKEQQWEQIKHLQYVEV